MHCKRRLNQDSGVNIDEEMTNLLNLQSAYGANARVFSAVKDMFDDAAEYVRRTWPSWVSRVPGR